MDPTNFAFVANLTETRQWASPFALSGKDDGKQYQCLCIDIIY